MANETQRPSKPSTRAWQASWGDPPPDGVVVPELGDVVEAKRGEPNAPYIWYGTFKVEAVHPTIMKRRHDHQQRYGGQDIILGAIGAELYREQLVGHGITVGADTKSYMIGDKLRVMIDTTAMMGVDDGDTFTIYVVSPGGL
jgi:hypothetical protein